ncbi:Hypothetical Protein FCC1311_110792 [Hondaea fermentalgiana]|uniref:30S ribosomal protein S21 n=1 Tax=Hondaea fermentalgiana TaxID=2315210 RepID=A0A2R5GVI6_9STRA|nr:Hypothetical Protein FCC1311_110792 [Hondaea fermentalgiana]|eukprot:GBG34856.1 Hypothetical Protein FCC1311_110792 [Hondaea fermentalgiana]
MWQQQQRFMSRNIEDTVATGVRVRGSVDQAIGRLTRMLRNENMLMAHKSQFRHEKPAVRRFREKKEAKRRAEKQEIKRLVREALKMKELGY